MTETHPGPPVYTHGHHESVLRSHRWRTVDNSAAYLKAHLRPGLSLLDVGCGPGTITADVAARLTPGTVLGIDASPDVVAQARTDYPAVDFAEGDIYRLPFDAGTWDIVHAHQVLQHLADPVAALREMRRVVKPGGVVAVRDSDYSAFRWSPASDQLDRWRALYRQIARANGGEPDAGRFVAGWAREAGFARVEASASVWRFETPEDRAWWGGTWAERITSSAIARQAVRDELATPADLESMATGWRAWIETEGAWFVVPHGEAICHCDRNVGSK